MKLNSIIIFFFIIQYYVVSEIFNHFDIDKIDNCVQYIYAPSRFNLYLYDQVLCIQCEIGYVVSKNYKSCIHFMFQLSYLNYGNCKRLSDDGKCAEALDGIELLPNNLFIIVKDQKFLERCAIVDENEYKCLFPRFGYILDVQTNNIFKDTQMTFCALFDSHLNQCTKFQQRFVRYINTSQGVYIGENFISPNLLSSNSTIPYLYCQDNYYLYYKDFNGVDGCFSDIVLFVPFDRICQHYEALSDDKQKCEIIIPFCQEYLEIQGNKLCSKCIPFYRLHLQTCIELIGCEIISIINPNKCLKCKINRVLVNGECVFENERKLQIKNLEEQKQGNRYLQNQLQKPKSIDQLSQNVIDYNDNNQEQTSINMQKNVNISQRKQKNFEKRQQTPEIEKKNKFQFLSKNHFLQQNYDQNDDKCEICISNDQKCIQCHNQIECYLDEEKNRCQPRKYSLYCDRKIKNSDNCLNLSCQHKTILNPSLIENFDLKNEETLNYLSYLIDINFQIDQLVTNQEIQNLNQKLQFYGIHNKSQHQMCSNISQYIKSNEFIYFKETDLHKCPSASYQLLNNSNIPFLIFQCENELNAQNIIVDKCIRYDQKKQFCLQCVDGFHFNSVSMTCEISIKNCIIHSKQNTCIICQSGYQLIDGIFCQEICGIAVPGSLTQFHSFYIIENSNIEQTICKKTNIPCKRFLNDKCIECFEGYVLDQSLNFSCIQDIHFPDCKIIDKFEQNNLIQNQNTHTFNGKKCIQCLDEHVLYQGLCFCQKINCLNYVTCNQNSCFKKFRTLFIGQLNLKSNQYLESQGDIYKVLNCNIPNCIQCLEGNTCLKCKLGYVFQISQHTCVDVKQKEQPQIQEEKQACLKYDYQYTLKCQLCKHGYYLMQDFRCYKQCLPGYQIIDTFQQGSICIQIPFACQQFSFDLNLFLAQGKVTCILCVKGYFLYQEDSECKKICIYYIFQQNKVTSNPSQIQCVKNCNPYFLLEGRQCSETCPKFYKVIQGKFLCAEMCQGLFIYEDNNLKCTDQCDYGYISILNELICRKCQAANCFKCSSKQQNYCIECHSQYKSVDGICKYICENLALVNVKEECQFNIKIQFCQIQEQGKCIKCAKNFKYDEIENKCICQTLITYFDSTTNTCNKYCDENCQICNNNQCTQCKPNAFLIQNRLISRCVQKCPIGYFPKQNKNEIIYQTCVQCPLQCFSCTNLLNCTECKSEYNELPCNDSSGNVYCQISSQPFKGVQSYRDQCCMVQNCKICSLDFPQTCQKCDDRYPYLYLNTCLQVCPEGTYADEQYECQKCHILCRTCLSKLSCLSCVLPQSMVDSDRTCRCLNKKVFFKNQCYSLCPRFTKLVDEENNRICQLYCLENNSYPVFDDEGIFQNCEYNVSQQDSKFCDQNLINLNQYITLAMKSLHLNGYEQSIIITITVAGTPKECYDFNLRFNPRNTNDFLNLEFKELKIDNQQNFQFILQSDIKVSELKQHGINQCKQNICTLFLQIQHRGILKQTYILKANLKSDVIQIQYFQQNSQNSIQKIQVEQSHSRIYPILNSVLSVNCEDFIVCTYQSIISYPSTSLIFHINTLFDDTNNMKQQLVLIPIQIYIIQQDSKLVNINDFFYDNFYPSKLKIEIHFNEIVEGKLFFLIQARDWDDYLLEIPFCVEYIQAPSRISQYLYDQILCIQCQLGYVVSKNFKECIEFRYELNYLQYGNCKRLAQSGFCAEALDGIELLTNHTFIIVQEQKFLERCAIVDEKQQKCIYPRFGYVLDIQKGFLFKDTELTFCALYDSIINDCIEFQPRFVRIDNTKIGTYIGDSFVNSHLISNNSTQLKIDCQEGLIYLNNSSQKSQGCFQNIQNSKIQNCLNQYQTIYCHICEIGFALRDDKLTCEKIIPNCQKFMVIHNKNVCIQCIQSFKLQFQKCIQIINCFTFSKQNPNKCIACQLGYRLQNDECISIKLASIQEEKYFLEDSERNQNGGKRILLSNSKLRILSEHFYQKKLRNYKNSNDLNKRNLLRNLQLEDYYDGEACLAFGDKQCVQCIDNQKYYFDEKKHKCVERIYSKNCVYNIFNSDNCQNLECYNPFFLNEKFIELLDLKNTQTIEYFKYIRDKQFKSESIMSEQEIEQLKNNYLSLGINLTLLENQCHKYDKYQTKSCVQFQYECKCSNNTQLSLNLNKEFSYLVFDCVQELNIENQLIDKCVKYDLKKSFCFECEEGYYFNSKTMFCEKKIQNCLIHSLKNTCIICQSGYQLINNTICQPVCGSYIPGTQTFYNSFIQNNYDDQITICKKFEIPCFKFINNQCVQCIDGYVLDKTKDFTCIRDIHFPNCKVIEYIQDYDKINKTSSYLFNGKECKECQQDYVLKQGLCFCQKQKCLDYIFCDENQCFKKYVSIFIGHLNLPSNHYLEKQGKIYKALECKISFCFQCEEGNVCIKCFQGFYYDKNSQKCVYNGELKYIVDSNLNYPVESACQVYDLYLKDCIRCREGYFLMEDLRCYQKCRIGQKIQKTQNNGNICFGCSIGCQQCIFQIDLFLKHKNQETCLFCHQDYYLQDQICKKECNFYKTQDKTKCIKICSQQQMFQLDQYCVSQCPSNFYLSQGFEKICIDSCQELLRYEDDQFKCSKQCQEGYAQVDQICKKCQDENCLICNPNNLSECLLCQQAQIHKYYVKEVINIEGKCKIICMNQTLVEDYDNCSKVICNQQNQNDCQVCPETFINDNKSQSCICPPNTILIEFLKKCLNMCNEKCLECTPITQKCQKCQPGTFKIELDNNIIICLDYCPKGYFANSQSQQCFQCPESCFTCENDHNCYECQPFYTKVFYDEVNKKANCICQNEKCQKLCINQVNIYVQKKCCIVKECEICSEDKKICKKCFKTFPFLFLNTCLKQCPDGFYADQHNNCIVCDLYCKTCNNNSMNCTSCVLNKYIAQSETCRCRDKKVFYSKQCYSFCPKFTKLIKENGFCQEYCKESNSFPVFDDNGEFERCESHFTGINTKLCEQNLINLDKYITFSIENSNQQISAQNQQLNIIIQIALTPKECYDFQLRANLQDDSNSFQLMFKDYSIFDQLNFNFRLKSTIDISQFQQNSKEQFNKNSLNLFFQIYLQNQLRMIFKLEFSFVSKLISVKSISQIQLIQNEIKLLDQINQENILVSKLSVKCEGFKTCSNQSVLSYPTLTVDFKIILENDKKLIIHPLSVYIMQDDKTLIQIENFYYQNFFPSQIELSIQFQQIVKGKLFMIFKTNSWDYRYQGYEYFNKRCNGCQFVVQNIDVEVIDQKVYEKYFQEPNLENNTQPDQNITEIMFIFNIIISFLIFLQIVVKCIQKVKIRKSTYQKQIDEQESKYFQENIETKKQIEPRENKDIFIEFS
ncbi:hypothetical protein ABPG73_014233 [Tetrahymena malaccensis]